MTRIQIAEDVVSREIGGTLVVLDVARRAYFQLDRSAAAIWRAIDSLGRVDLVVAACASAFAGGSENVEQDVRQFVADAVRCGLLDHSDGNVAESPQQSADAPAMSVDRSGIRVGGDVDALRRQFVEQPYVELPGFVAPGLLSIVERAVQEGAFVDRAHPGIGRETCLETGAATMACQLVLNDPALLDLVTRIAGCAALRCFDGRVYRLQPESGHYDSWHSDASDDRMVGLSVNLSRDTYEGGLLEIRQAVSSRAEYAVASRGFGSAVLFRISPDLRHRVTPVSGRPRTAYAGWFRGSPDFADAFTMALNARDASIAFP